MRCGCSGVGAQRAVGRLDGKTRALRPSCTPLNSRPPLPHPGASDFGESHSWPDYACAYGQFDIAGSPKPHAYIYNVNWLQLLDDADAGRPPAPVQAVARLLDLVDQLPCDATGCTISAVSTGHTNELLVDNVSVGIATPATVGDPVSWHVPYLKDASTRENCSFPKNFTGVQCKDLEARKAAKNPAACEAACCGDTACDTWQFDVSGSKGCWMGVPTSCDKAGAGWVGAGRFGPPGPGHLNISTVEVRAKDAHGTTVAADSVRTPASHGTMSLRSDLDIPSPSTGTGRALLLDGVDAGLVRVTLVDAAGVLVSTSPRNVSFEVVSGPGRIVGVGSGDPASHSYQQGNVAATFAGTVKAVVRVTVDCTSAGRGLAQQIDSDSGKDGSTTIVAPGAPETCGGFDKQPIIVRARAGSLSVQAAIALSTDVGADGYLAVARASARDLTEYTYLADFRG